MTQKRDRSTIQFDLTFEHKIVLELAKTLCKKYNKIEEECKISYESYVVN